MAKTPHNQHWPPIPLGEVLRHRKQFISIDDLRTYKRCRVQLHAQGVVLRDELPGAEIRTKTQQVCRAGEFLVAEIDAKHGGYGLVPPSLDEAIVSSHYFLFEIEASALDPAYLAFFCQTAAFREQVAAQGSTNYAAIRPAHVLGYRIPLPPLPEQRRIVARIEQLAAKIDQARALRRQAAEEAEAIVLPAKSKALKPQRTWRTVPLETVCETIVDCLHSNPIYADDGIPTVRSPDVGWGMLLLESARRTGEAEYQRRTQRGEPREGDMILVREGGGTGKAALVEAGQRLSLGQRVMLLRPDTRQVLPRFLLHQWLSPVVYQEQILSRLKGSASPHLNIGALRQFRFFLPPLPEQRRIVAYLDDLSTKLDALKKLQAETAAQLDALLPSILDKAFKGEL